jgi:hypothetical protein
MKHYSFNFIRFENHYLYEQGLLVELVEQQPATRCVVGSIPACSALKVWLWTWVLNSLVG